MTELLAPAGNTESFKAALSAGADAVYLGGRQFGARAFADNFSEEELIAAIDLAHLHKRKVYLTVNTLMKEQELDLLPAFLEPFYQAGLDGVIVADPGAIRRIHASFPDLPLHASTQMTLTGPLCESLLKDRGVTRVVPARELSLKELADWKEKGSLELEVFIHGAMCYAYSGQCLLSSMLGKRSGNRGRCGGACRLPYHTLAGGKVLSKESELYQLSLKDLCGLPLVPRLMEMGIDSFKIEGRMKSPEYVYTITSLYRKYMDLVSEGREFVIEEADLAILGTRFNRGSLSSGYFERHGGREMVLLTRSGYTGSRENTGAGSDEKGTSSEESKAKSDLIPALAKIPVRGSLYLTVGKPASLTLKAVGKEATFEAKAAGEAPQVPQNRPVGKEQIAEQLSKLGNTPYVMGELQFFYKEETERDYHPYDEEKVPLFMGIKGLNELRRNACEALTDQILKTSRRTQPALDAGNEDEQSNAGRLRAKDLFGRKGSRITQEEKQTKTCVSLRTIEQLRSIPEDCYNAIDCLFLSYDLLRVKALLPAVDAVIDRIREKRQESDPEKQLSVYCVLPQVTRNSVLKELEGLLERGTPFGSLTGYVAGSMEALAFLREKCPKAEVITAPSLAVFQRESVLFYDGIGIKSHVLPYELTAQEMGELLSSCESLAHTFILPVYGYIPVMVSAGCLRATNNACLMEYASAGRREKETGESITLLDRMQKHFPVVLHCDRCENTIYNTVPLSLHKDKGDVKRLQAGGILISLTVEDASTCEEVLRSFLSVQNRGSWQPKEFTRGHFLKGVE